jgi:RNA polymerase sigma factor (sigma-70 family)
VVTGGFDQLHRALPRFHKNIPTTFPPARVVSGSGLPMRWSASGMPGEPFLFVYWGIRNSDGRYCFWKPYWEGRCVADETRLARFEQAVLPHLDAAYNLARWLTRDDHDAEDVVQDAYLRALRFFDGFHGTDGRVWLLAIVRNTCYTWLEKNRAHKLTLTFDEEVHGGEAAGPNPESILTQKEDSEALRRALDKLPMEFREAIVLRELEGLSYKEIANISGIPLGTVMSRLARAREKLAQCLNERNNEEH